MLKIAFSDKEMEYFHLISGQDYPVASMPDFDTFFDAKRPVGLMSATRENIFDWQQRYEVFHFTDLIDKRSHPHLFFIAHCLSFIQSKLFNIGIRIRSVVPLTTYYGSNWFSLNREVVSYVLGFLKENKRYLRRFRFTYACDEIFFQTILYNSPYAGKIENNNYRYTDWSLHKSGPKTLIAEDFEQIMKSNNLFCRKVDSAQSKELLDRIDAEIL